VLDLSPDLPSLKLNPDFLNNLLILLATRFGNMDRKSFLGNRNFLHAVLTKYPNAFAGFANVKTIAKVNEGDIMSQVSTAMTIVRGIEPKIILAASPAKDTAWLARIITQWLNEPPN